MSQVSSSLDDLPQEMGLQEFRAHATKASKLLKAMSNQNRLMIMCTLAQGELCVGEINAKVQLSQSALSQHLAILHEEGLVARRRASQMIYYSMVPGPAQMVIGTLHDIYCPDH